MQYDEFIGKVQNGAAMPSRGDAERLTRTVLENLGARLQKDEANDLAAQLPQELGRHLLHAETLEKFGLNELFQRVAEGEGVDRAEAVYRTRVVIEALMQASSKGEIQDVLAQLPGEFSKVFTGAQGQMPNQETSWEVISQVIDNLHEVLRERSAKIKAKQIQASQAQAGQGQENQGHGRSKSRGQRGASKATADMGQSEGNEEKSMSMEMRGSNDGRKHVNR